MKKQDDQITQLSKHLDKRFDAIDSRFDSINQRFVAIDKRFDSLEQRFDAIEFRLESMESQLAGKAEKVDFERLYNSLDAILSEQEVEEQERLAMQHQLDRHEIALQKFLYRRAGRAVAKAAG